MAMRTRRDTTIYVGELPWDIRESELEDLFYKYGSIRRIDIKAHGRAPAYAFLEFDDARDASDAVRFRDGYRLGGSRIRVEVARGANGPPHPPSNWREKGTGYRIVVDGLPRSASWQDLKDMFRSVQTPVYTNVYSDSKGVFGVVEYSSHRELREVLRDMKGIQFQNKFCEPTSVTLIDDTDKDKVDDNGGSVSPRERERERSRDQEREDRERSRSRSRSRE